MTIENINAASNFLKDHCPVTWHILFISCIVDDRHRANKKAVRTKGLSFGSSAILSL